MSSLRELERRGKSASPCSSGITVMKSRQNMDTEQNSITDEVTATHLSEDLPLTEMLWDKRMRLTIRKDFSKERAQTLGCGTAAKDDRPAQQRFTCTVCQQAFLCASGCLSHIHSHHREHADLNDGILNLQTTHSTKQLRHYSLHDEAKLYHAQSEDLDGGSVNETVAELADFRESTMQGLPNEEISAFFCSQCSSFFPHAEDLNKHFEQSHASLDLGKSGGQISDTNVLTQHFNENHPKEKIYTSSTNVSKQNFHEKYPKEKIYTCSICSSSFSAQSSLGKHECIHKVHRLFSCEADGCDKTFADRASFNRHRRKHRQERPHVCPHCRKSFKMRSHLQEHVRLHTGERPFVCEHCGAGFAQSNGLKSHAKQHSLERDNQCDICHKAFSSPHILLMHRKTHSGERPFSCDQCHHKFLTAANLGAHKKQKHDVKATHRGEKLFTCDVCGAPFSQACNLGIHKKKKHSSAVLPVGDKIFFCDICDASFSEACNLGAHRKMKHPEQAVDGRTVFACDICGAKFNRKSNLANHHKRKHGDK